MSAFLCGGTPTPDDLAKVQEFAAALALPTEREVRLALIEMMAADGDEDAIAFLAERES